MDDMVKVDTKLFVTCRLCLEHLGQYQIVPQVQHRIKYCFDIDVGLFDGLPQLVCKKCKTIVTDYYEVKQNFVAKQATLKDKYVNTEHQTEEGVNENVNPFGGKRKRCRQSCSGSRLNSSDVCENNQDQANCDSSDDDIKDSRTRSRSRSSNETVILNDDNTDGHEQGSGEISDKEKNKYFSDGDCIKIVDSSDTESTHSNNRMLRDSADTTTVRAHTSDHKFIQNNIIISCKLKYMKKISTESESPAVDEEKLKHIILNMGQKVVTKQGFNCIGLLPFMLNADLNIKWIQANSRSPNSNNVYIQPKSVNESNVNKPELGWVELPGQHVTPINYVFESEENVNRRTSSNVVVPMSISQTDNSQGKLLNESPVANPKQLPKETYSNQGYTDPEPNFEPEDVNGVMCMPTITSTTSLAVSSAEAQETPSATDNVEMPNITSNESEKSHPRIKVKPLSELMSERVLKNLNPTQTNATNIWHTPQHTNIQPVRVSHVPLLMPNGINTNTLPDTNS